MSSVAIYCLKIGTDNNAHNGQTTSYYTLYYEYQNNKGQDRPEINIKFLTVSVSIENGTRIQNSTS